MPDRGHIHHRLLDLGLSHRRAVVVLYGVGGVFALSAFAIVILKNAWIASVLLAVLATSVAVFYALLYLRIRRLRPDGGRDEDRASGHEGSPADGVAP
jgi:UDP-GlcNAc:undecaprenyl-phosphate GlcNAc-1-phosphate transferase